MNVDVSIVACFCMWGGGTKLTRMIDINIYGILVGDLE